MAENTKIEWADHTFSPWTGCTKVSPACDHCYAEGWAKRSGHVKWGSGQPRRRTSDANWRMPLKWNREAERTGVRPRVFCASLADVFDNEVDPAWRADLFKLIADTQNLNWLLLTKRVGNVMKMANEVADMPRLGSHTGHLIAHQWRNGSPPKNVWLGATVVNQEEADRDIPKLLAVPAAKRFLSIEPMLGPMLLQEHALSRIDWVIVGGESGPGARPIHPDWARSIRDQCAAAGVPFLFKQWGDWRQMTHADLTTLPASTPMGAVKLSGEFLRPFCENDAPFTRMVRVGKAAAGRLLDGREWNEAPA